MYFLKSEYCIQQQSITCVKTKISFKFQSKSILILKSNNIHVNYSYNKQNDISKKLFEIYLEFMKEARYYTQKYIINAWVYNIKTYKQLGIFYLTGSALSSFIAYKCFKQSKINFNSSKLKNIHMLTFKPLYFCCGLWNLYTALADHVWLAVYDPQIHIKEIQEELGEFIVIVHLLNILIFNSLYLIETAIFTNNIHEFIFRLYNNNKYKTIYDYAYENSKKNSFHEKTFKFDINKGKLILNFISKNSIDLNLIDINLIPLDLRLEFSKIYKYKK
uniref:Transmembrane protein n=1 Tax=Nitzschia alba TaxID=2858 RepID=A0A5C0F3F9_NITAL|nr:hypothetical protein [Nitzschia alba]QEI59613.1 hypothetical protein [Nitzschia alba]